MYSRLYLQNIPKQIDVLVSLFIRELKAKAALGETSYLCESMLYEQFDLSTEILIPAFKLRFPDCKIVYQETWSVTESRDNLCKIGVLIDWS